MQEVFFLVFALLKRLLTPSMFYLLSHTFFPSAPISFVVSIHFLRRHLLLMLIIYHLPLRRSI